MSLMLADYACRRFETTITLRSSKSDIIRAWARLNRECPCIAKAKRTMKAWYYFWVLNFVVAGSAFFIIAVIVTIRGVGDLREMFARLRATHQAENLRTGVPPSTI